MPHNATRLSFVVFQSFLQRCPVSSIQRALHYTFSLYWDSVGFTELDSGLSADAIAVTVSRTKDSFCLLLWVSHSKPI
jgi:hypothetical protein